MKLKYSTLNLLTVIIMGLSTVFLMAPVNAQNSDEPTRPRINHQQIVSQLHLDEATQQALLQLMNKFRSQHQSQKRMQSYDDHKIKREMREKHRAEIKALLGEEKFEAFEKAMWMLRQQRRSMPEK